MRSRWHPFLNNLDSSTAPEVYPHPAITDPLPLQDSHCLWKELRLPEHKREIPARDTLSEDLRRIL